MIARRLRQMGYVLVCFVGMYSMPAQAQFFTSWKMARQANVIPFASPATSHGHSSSFAAAPAIPTWPSAVWTDAPDARDINFSQPSRHCGLPKDCLVAGDFNFYRTTLHFPGNAKVQTLRLRMWAVDDGVRLTIINSKYPQGITPPGTTFGLPEVRKDGAWAGSVETPDLSSYMVVNDANVLVLTHVDDCCSMMVLQRVEILADDKLVQRNEFPKVLSTPVPYAIPGVAYKYVLRVEDPDQDPIVINLRNVPSQASFDTATKTFTLTPSAQDLGQSLPFQVEVCDPKGACVSHQWSIQIQAKFPNHPPTITSEPALLLRYGDTYQYQAVGEDQDQWDQGGISYRLIKSPAGAVIGAYTGLLEWKASAQDAYKSHEFVLESCDTLQACVQQKWLVVVRGTAAPIVLTQPSLTTAIGHLYRYTPQLLNPEKGATYTWKYIKGPNISFFPNTGALSWQVPLSWLQKTADFTIEVCTNLGVCEKQSWSVEVQRYSPEFWLESSPAVYVVHGQVYSYTTITAPAGLTAQSTLIRGPNGASLRGNILTWTPYLNDIGQEHRFELKSCEPHSSICLTQDWKVRVIQANRAPAFVSNPVLKAHEKHLYQYDIRAEDPDQDDTFRWYRLRKGPAHAALLPLKGTLTWTPDSMTPEENPFVVEVCDLTGACTSQSWTVKVTPFPFRFDSQPGEVAEVGKQYTYTPRIVSATGAEIEGVWSLREGPDGAVMIPKTGEIQWTPRASDGGSAMTFVLNACHSGGDCLAQTWRVAIAQSSIVAPTFESSPGDTAFENEIYTYHISLKSSGLSKAPSLTRKEGPDDAVLQADSTGSYMLTWKPVSGDVGRSVVFALEACSGSLHCTIQQWTIRVAKAKDTPAPAGCTTDADCNGESQCLEGICQPRGVINRNVDPVDKEGGATSPGTSAPPEIQSVGCGCTSGSAPPAPALPILLLLCFGLGLRLQISGGGRPS